jgi:hypothetical protein
VNIKAGENGTIAINMGLPGESNEEPEEFFDFNPDDYEYIYYVPGKISWNNAVNQISAIGNGDFAIIIDGDITIDGYNAATFGATPAGSHLYVTVISNGKTITLSNTADSSLLYIGQNQTVTIQDVSLKGNSSNTKRLVYNDTGTFIMESGSAISGNKGGVMANGTFIMNGGEISGIILGEPVYIYGTSNFTMTGGKIINNDCSDGGSNGHGGVYVLTGSTFTMTGGEISGNSGYVSGGVTVYGTFTMSGGTISNNSGRGVDVSGTFNLNSPATMGATGNISGNTPSNVFISSGGTLIVNGTAQTAGW